MKWLKSAGGPLLCVESRLIACWRGAGEESCTELGTTDYQRACRVQDYLGKIKVGDGEALVLGDMPLETTIHEIRERVPVIVRLIYADAAVDIPTIVNEFGDALFDEADEQTVIGVRSHNMTIIDATSRGESALVEGLHFQLHVGKHLVLTKAVKPDDRTSILLHAFFLLS